MSWSFLRKSLQQNHRASWAAREPVRILSLVLHTALGKGCRRPIWDFSFPLHYPRSLEVRQISGLVLNRADLLQNITDLKDLLMEAEKMTIAIDKTVRELALENPASTRVF